MVLDFTLSRPCAVAIQQSTSYSGTESEIALEKRAWEAVLSTPMRHLTDDHLSNISGAMENGLGEQTIATPTRYHYGPCTDDYNQLTAFRSVRGSNPMGAWREYRLAEFYYYCSQEAWYSNATPQASNIERCAHLLEWIPAGWLPVDPVSVDVPQR